MSKRKVSSQSAIGRSKTATRGKSKAKSARAKSPVQVLSSKLSYDGPLFRVFTDEISENGHRSRRDVIRHNGSVVILALDQGSSGDRNDPLVVMERQYRHAAKQYLLEVPAGKLEEGEDPLPGARRELFEETGFRAKRWRKIARYYASPGFLGEWMQVYLAEGLEAGDANPDEDEQIEIEMIPLSKLLSEIERGKIHDGKTLISVMLYDRLHRKRTNTAHAKK
jgi:ADP-ribose pyrophosphatase